MSDGEDNLFTYLRLLAYRWVKFEAQQEFEHLIYYVDGAPRRRDRTLTCQPHPSMEH